jgi:hypothetical protein
VSLYWFSTAGPAHSSQWYYETSHDLGEILEKFAEYMPVKMGISRFPKDLHNTPKCWGKTLGDVVGDQEYS